jgi:hypothetical protein
LRRIAVNDDLTMVIGPGTDGALLEIGRLDLTGEDPVDPRNDATRASARGFQLVDVDPAPVE